MKTLIIILNVITIIGIIGIFVPLILLGGGLQNLAFSYKEWFFILVVAGLPILGIVLSHRFEGKMALLSAVIPIIILIVSIFSTLKSFPGRYL